MAYAFQIGKRYLRSKKRSTVSVITFVAVAGVALGVGALLAVLSITTGFQDEFRNKVLGVNAHVLVLKYGLDFEEYRDVIQRVESSSGVSGAAPFVIHEMMMAKGDRLSGVLVKGIDPQRSLKVLDLPRQIVDGSLEGLRLQGAAPPIRPDELEGKEPEGKLDSLLRSIQSESKEGKANEAPTPRKDGESDLLADTSSKGKGTRSPKGAAAAGETAASAEGLRRAESALADMDDDGDPAEALDDALQAQILAEVDLKRGEDKARKLPGVVVGCTLAKTLGLGVGDQVKIVSPLSGLDVSVWSSSAKAPSSRDFRVIAIFEAGFQEYDSRLAYVDLYEAQHFFEQGDTVTGVEIRLDDLERAPGFAKRLEKSLGEGPFHTLDWAELNHNLFTALEVQKIMLSLVIATIIFVAAFNVIATLIIMVLEKKREIAILKAMGASDRTVLGVFMVQGVVIGWVGTCIGLLLGGGVCWYLSRFPFPLDPKVYLIDHLPVHTSWSEFLVTVLVALGICISSTLLPSLWAARMWPAEGLRYK